MTVGKTRTPKEVMEVLDQGATFEYILVVLVSVISELISLSNTGPEGGVKSLINFVGSFPAF